MERITDIKPIHSGKQNSYSTSWLLKEAKFGRLPLLETTISSLSSARCAPFWERYLDLLDSFNDVTETYHLTSWQFHQALLNHITWLYWTVSPGVTGPYHLTLLDSFTLRYWNLSHDVTQSTGQQSSRSICNNQLIKLRLFLEMIAINMTNFSMT